MTHTQSQPSSPQSHVEGNAVPRYARARDLQLRDALAIFMRQTPPKILVAGVALMFGVRMWLGAFTWWDLLPAAALIALQPVAEWLIHVYILHFRPRTKLGIKLDMNAAKHHRAHHIDPWDLRYVVMPKSAIAVGIAIALPAAWLIFPTVQIGASALLATAALALTYEWAHFLTHTSYRPRGTIYKRIYKFHRLHHFKNEKYWMGVSRHFGDTLFGTMKQANEVETSPTARNLLAQTQDENQG